MQNPIQRYFLFLLACGLFSFACEEYTQWKLKNPAEESRLVVEAILTNEFRTQKIKLSQSFQELNQEVPTITDAIVQVEANAVVYDFQADPNNPGMYLSEERFRIFDNLVYTLTIDWQGVLYTASSELSAVAPIPEFVFQEVDMTDSFSFMNADINELYNINQQAMYEIDIDWSHLSTFEPVQAKIFFYTFKNYYINQLVLPQREEVLFPRGSIIQVKKFGLNDDFASFLQSMNLETTWNGNFFYGPSTDVPSNISPDALGFFSTCAVLTDTLIAE